MNNIILILLEALLLCFFIGPFILTFFNIFNLFPKKKIKPNLIDALTFIFGVILTVLFYRIKSFEDYQIALRIGEYHTPIASWSFPTVITICILGIISYILIRTKKLDLSPIMIVISMSGNLIGLIFSVVCIIQIFKNIGEIHSGIFYFVIFPINYILCSIRAEIEIIKKYKEKQESGEVYNDKFLNGCNNFLMKIDIESWPIIAIILVIPLLIITISILVLFGQRPDEIIKAFTETSDWSLSQKYSPPPLTYDEHYLCTVSLRGHKKIVKPLRYGIRKNEKIVVNRQLCIANAFEQLIEEKTPKFHHFIRYIYDKYGYPLSKHINTAWQADITYILMKPLEWIFLIVLYLFDKKPENRIAMQYMPKNY